MKKVVILITTFIFLISSVYGISFEVSEKIPSNANWSFSVNLGSSSEFTRADVFLDGDKILTAYNTESPVWKRDERVIKGFVKGDEEIKLQVSFFGLNKGTHSIRVETYKNDSLVEEQTIEVEMFEQDFSELREEFNAQIEETKNTLNALIEETKTSVEEKLKEIAEIKNSLSELSAAIESTKNLVGEEKEFLLQEIESKANTLSEKINAFEEKLKEQEAELEKKADKLGLSVTLKEKKTPKTGMITGINPVNLLFPFAIFFGALMLMRGIMLLAAERKGKSFSFSFPKPKFGGKGKKIFEEELEPKRPFAGKKGSEKKKEEEIKIRPGDLILKKR